jgi:hypothetical protein
MIDKHYAINESLRAIEYLSFSWYTGYAEGEGDGQPEYR